MAMSAGRDDGEPMMDMNTTPLIDVMLVLLVMFIITIPIQTHAVKIDLPPKSIQPPPLVKPIKNDLIVTPESTITWNGGVIDLTTLKTNLVATLQMPAEPELHFAPAAEARYELVDTVLATIKYAKIPDPKAQGDEKHISKMGFVGNEAYTDF